MHHQSSVLQGNCEVRSDFLGKNGNLPEIGDNVWLCAKQGHASPEFCLALQNRSDWVELDGIPHQSIPNTAWAGAMIDRKSSALLRKSLGFVGPTAILKIFANTERARCAKLGHPSSTLFAKAIQNRDVRLTLSIATPQGVVVMAWACTKLGSKAPTLFDADRSTWLLSNGTPQTWHGLHWAINRRHCFEAILTRSDWFIAQSGHQSYCGHGVGKSRDEFLARDDDSDMFALFKLRCWEIMERAKLGELCNGQGVVYTRYFEQDGADEVAHFSNRSLFHVRTWAKNVHVYFCSGHTTPAERQQPFWWAVSGRGEQRKESVIVYKRDEVAAEGLRSIEMIRHFMPEPVAQFELNGTLQPQNPQKHRSCSERHRSLSVSSIWQSAQAVTC